MLLVQSSFNAIVVAVEVCRKGTMAVSCHVTERSSLIPASKMFHQPPSAGRPKVISKKGAPQLNFFLLDDVVGYRYDTGMIPVCHNTCQWRPSDHKDGSM